MAAARAAALLAGLWAGVMLCIGLLAAPAGFALTVPSVAGRIAGRLFSSEAYLSLALCALLFALLRREAGRRAGPLFSTDMALVLAALFCTVAGYFAVQPMMAAARAGEGAWSFGALHAVSSAFFAAKGLVVLALAWRLTRR